MQSIRANVAQSVLMLKAQFVRGGGQLHLQPHSCLATTVRHGETTFAVTPLFGCATRLRLRLRLLRQPVRDRRQHGRAAGDSHRLLVQCL
eukprot:SAG11_NODE_4670_length_1813_cov_1.348308_2_plen_90_part_00